MEFKNTLITGGILDVETTGLSPYDNEVIELCLILFTYNRIHGEIEVLQEYVGLREPGCRIHPRAAMVHGLTYTELRGKDLDYQVVSDMIGRAEFLIAHNARFDRGFVIPIFPQAAQKPWYCSMSGINWRSKGFQNRRLQYLLGNHDIKVDRAHRALDDVRATLQLLSFKQSSGLTYLHELLAMHKAVG